MSGWIKFEKDLKDDIRVRRMAATLQGIHTCNGGAFQYVTLVLGGLAQLWMHADSFARDDDTLDLTANEIDQLTGIESFSKVVPHDWLQIIDEYSVKLPGFHQHNGTDAKRKALTAKRVARHRDAAKLDSVSPGNGYALPDQTRLYQDQKRPEIRGDARGEPRAARSAACRLPKEFELSEDRKAYAIGQAIDPASTFENFKDYWTAASGAKARKHDWDATWRMWCRNQSERKTQAHEPKKTRFAQLTERLEAKINAN